MADTPPRSIVRSVPSAGPATPPRPLFDEALEAVEADHEHSRREIPLAHRGVWDANVALLRSAIENVRDLHSRLRGTG